jgi:hypothetical protein
MKKSQGKARKRHNSNRTEAPAGNGILGYNRSEWIGSMRNSIRILGDIVSPANDEEEWEVLRDENQTRSNRIK